MAGVDVTNYLEKYGVRKARFGGYEPEDVKEALADLCAEYERQLTVSENMAMGLKREKERLEKQCQRLMQQNQTLSGQNATLAGHSERYSRLHGEMDSQLSSLRERNHSLGDQLAVLRLKNADLNRENASLKDRAEEAEAALRIKGRDLDAQRAELSTSRQQRLDEAETEAQRILGAARSEAQRMLNDAQINAAAIERTAREQMHTQAKEVMTAVHAEATEAQNAYQMRLNDMSRVVDAMEERQSRLAEYLLKVSKALADTERFIREEHPEPTELPPVPPDDVQLKEIIWKEPKLDLTPEAIEETAKFIRVELASEMAAPELRQPPRPLEELTTPLIELAPSADSPAPDGSANPHSSIQLLAELGTEIDLDNSRESPTAELERFSTPPRRGSGEVPGAIFSAPILQQKVTPDFALTPPPAGAPHQPVLPVLTEDEEEAPLPPTPQKAVAKPVGTRPVNPNRRKKAVYAARALHRKLQKYRYY